MPDVVDDASAATVASTSTTTTTTPSTSRTSTDKDYARACADVVANLAKWDAQSRAVRDASRYLLGLQFVRAVQAPDGSIWAAHVMAGHVRQAEARSAKAVFERRVALVQLTAWVNVRKAQPDMRNVYGRERDTCVMDILEKSTRDGTCSRARWLSYYRAGRRWMGLVQKFGGGVLVFRLPLLGMKW
jgi:hypothetical protein